MVRIAATSAIQPWGARSSVDIRGKLEVSGILLWKVREEQKNLSVVLKTAAMVRFAVVLAAFIAVSRILN